MASKSGSRSIWTSIIALLLIADFALLVSVVISSNRNLLKASVACHIFLLMLVFAGVWFTAFFSSRYCSTMASIFEAVFEFKTFWLCWLLYMGAYVLLVVLLADEERNYDSQIAFINSIKAVLAVFYYYATKSTILGGNANQSPGQEGNVGGNNTDSQQLQNTSPFYGRK